VISVCIVSPAWGRFAVTRLVLAQRQRLCGELASRGIDARTLIVADDENLEIAAEYGCQTIQAPNLPLGKKCNTGLHHAARQGADYIVWVGSDDWIHPDVFEPLLDLPSGGPAVIFAGTRVALVDLRTGVLQRVASPSKFGAIPWLIDSRLFTTRTIAPIKPELRRGLDGALIRGLRHARVDFEWSFHDPHDFRCVDFKSDLNITPYKVLAKHLGIGEPEQAWEALAGWFDADLIDQARSIFAAQEA
jgi:glycosyltransferase involved in cell wall biosynthesis